ncbi:MAG: elongation factor P [Rhodospirillaceae bacterium]|nr:elongation factor P [Rhodospirillaceae bacterium]|tara:strand:- start:876 stop:1442 length:567 start_codon:yes stop_codon:yes gene_type:complete
MKINGNAVRVGNVIEHNNRLWLTVKTQAVKPGKGGAFNQVELKDLRNGSKLNERFRADEQVERVRLEQTKAQFLFRDGSILTFMDSETYEQTMIDLSLLGDQAIYLQDGMEVIIESYEDEPLSVLLPDTVAFEVTEADAVVKGQTASSSYKPAVLENGAKIMVPPHIEPGTRVVIKPEDGTYVERAKD